MAVVTYCVSRIDGHRGVPCNSKMSNPVQVTATKFYLYREDVFSCALWFMAKRQENFASLDIAEQVKNDNWIHKLFDHEAFSSIIPVKCDLLRPESKSSESSDCNENAILESWYTYIAHEIERSRNFKPETCVPTSTTYNESVFEPLKRINHSGPPKRFRRRGAMWETMTGRMIQRTSKSSLKGRGLC
jgi:hypothetical protein